MEKPMKIASLFCLLFLGLNGNASPCLTKIQTDQRLNLTAQQVACISKTENGKVALTILCNVNQSATSIQYMKYLEFQSAYKEAYEKYSRAMDPESKNAARVQMGSITRDWTVFGYRADIEYALSVFVSDFRCRGQ